MWPAQSLQTNMTDNMWHTIRLELQSDIDVMFGCCATYSVLSAVFIMYFVIFFGSNVQCMQQLLRPDISRQHLLPYVSRIIRVISIAMLQSSPLHILTGTQPTICNGEIGIL